jgi:hypothetical protein
VSPFPALPKPPILHGMTPEDIEKTIQAHNLAYRCIVAAGEWLAAPSHSTPYSDYFRKWFESSFTGGGPAGEAERRVLVAAALNNVAKRMSKTSVAYKRAAADDPDCWSAYEDWLGRDQKEERLAYAKVGETAGEPTGAIGLCRQTFDDHVLHSNFHGPAEWMRALILVHENYHATIDTTGTQKAADRNYDWAACLALASQDPNGAAKNAQNYAFFVMDAAGTTAREPVLPQTDYGIWSHVAAGHGWAPGAKGGWTVDGFLDVGGPPGVAELTGPAIPHPVVMLAYRAPDSQGAVLRFRMMYTSGQEAWIGPYRFLAKRGDLASSYHAAVGLRSLTAPAIAAGLTGPDAPECFCVYVDADTKKLMCVRADAAGAGRERSWEYLVWGDDVVLSDGPLLEGKATSAAVAMYRPLADGSSHVNLSTGLYCVFARNINELDCMARLDVPSPGRPQWVRVPFDTVRKTNAAPALAMFNGQLKCAYVDFKSSTDPFGRLVMLTYHPAETDGSSRTPRVGTWTEDESAPAMPGVSTIALQQWISPFGPKLVALAGRIDGESVVQCSIYTAAIGWSVPVPLPTVTSVDAPALLEVGDRQYLFYQGQGGLLHARVAVTHAY